MQAESHKVGSRLGSRPLLAITGGQPTCKGLCRPPGWTCWETVSVMVALAWLRRSETTTFTGTPSASSRVAWVWRRSWSGLLESFSEVVQEPELLLLDQQVPDTDGRGDGPLHESDRRQGGQTAV